MARPMGSTNKVDKPEVVEEKKANVTTAEEIIQRKAILDGADSEKSKKDVMLKNIAELEVHIKHLQDRSSELTNDFEVKKKALSSINDSISGAQFELNNLQG